MPTDTSIKHARRRTLPPSDHHFTADIVLPAPVLSVPGVPGDRNVPAALARSNGYEGPQAGGGDSSPHGDLGRPPTRSGDRARRDEGLLRTLWTRFFGRPPHRLLEEEERVPFLARILTVAQSLAVVLVLGHTEVPLLFGAALTVRILVAMALSVLIVTVVAADYCLIKTMQRVPVLARRAQWVSVGAYLAYALFVGLVEVSTYAVVLYVLDRNPGALLQSTPLLPTGGFLFIAQVVLRAALIFWTMVQLFLTARKLPVQPNTLTDHSAELLGGKALELIKALDTEHADLPMIFQAYPASVETSVHGGAGGWLAWGPLRKRAEAVAGVRRQHWTRLVETLKQFSAGRQDDLEWELEAARERQARLEEERDRLAAEREARVESEVGQRLTQLILHGQLPGELPAWAARLAPEVTRLLAGSHESRPPAVQVLTSSERAEQQEEKTPEVVAMRRRFMEERELRGVEVEEPGGKDGEDWLGASDLFRLIRRDARGKLVLGQVRAREILREIGQQRKAARGPQGYIAPFDLVMRTLAERGCLDEEALSWWNAYAAAKVEARQLPARGSSPAG